MGPLFVRSSSQKFLFKTLYFLILAPYSLERIILFSIEDKYFFPSLLLFQFSFVRRHPWKQDLSRRRTVFSFCSFYSLLRVPVLPGLVLFLDWGLSLPSGLLSSPQLLRPRASGPVLGLVVATQLSSFFPIRLSFGYLSEGELQPLQRWSYPFPRLLLPDRFLSLLLQVILFSLAFSSLGISFA